MIESPILNSLIAEKAAEAVHAAILAILADRFGPVPGDVEERLKAISDQDRLRELNKAAARCPDLEAFRQQLG
jgi:hypothetical protein